LSLLRRPRETLTASHNPQVAGSIPAAPIILESLVQAGLELVGIWMETRVRHTTVEAYMERMRVVAGHMIGDQTEAEVADYVAKIEAELRRRSGPRGWRYEFAKLFAIARKPGRGVGSPSVALAGPRG
jgi:hypothetical protein